MCPAAVYEAVWALSILETGMGWCWDNKD